MKSWPFKDPDELLDYDVDWTTRLYSADEFAAARAQDNAGQPVTIVPADRIASSTFSLPAGTPLAIGTGDKAPSFSDTATKVWLQGGTEGATYVITNEITTAAGRIMDQSMKLKVKSK